MFYCFFINTLSLDYLQNPISSRPLISSIYWYITVFIICVFRLWSLALCIVCLLSLRAKTLLEAGNASCLVMTQLNLFIFSISFSLDESVYVVDAGSGLSVVCAASGGDLEEPSLSDHPVHPTTGETSRGDGEILNPSLTSSQACRFVYPCVSLARLHVNRPCICVSVS